MRRFLLVNPWIEDFAAFDFWGKPVGLLRIAGALMDADAEVHLLDLLDRNHPWLEHRTQTDEWGRGKYSAEEIEKPRVIDWVPRRFRRYGLPREILHEKLPELPDVDAVLVTSAMTYWYTGVTETIKVLRARYPDVPIILGGIYATLLSEHSRLTSGADHVLPGSYTSIRLALESILGLKLPDETGPPAWNLYPHLDYAVLNISTGCPFSCTYCASNRLEPCFSPRDIPEILAEISSICALGLNRFAFYDDALLFHPGFTNLLKEIIDKELKLELHTPNGLHVSRIDRDRALLMRRAGFGSLYLSLETADQSLLTSTGAKLSVTDFTKAVSALKDAGFPSDSLHAYVLFGLPGQSEDSVRRTLDNALSNGVKPHLAEFSPVHGTIEFERAGLSPDTDPLLCNNIAWSHRPELKPSLERLREYLKEYH